MTQNALLLKTLQQGRSVTRLHAMHMGIMNLTARITELRDRGYDVRCYIKRDTMGRKYGEFHLAGDQ